MRSMIILFALMVTKSREEDDDWVTVATLSSHSNTVWDLAWDPAGLGGLFCDIIASHPHRHRVRPQAADWPHAARMRV